VIGDCCTDGSDKLVASFDDPCHNLKKIWLSQETVNANAVEYFKK